MKNIFFILSFTLLFVLKILGQAQIDIPFVLTDGTGTIQMAVGLDLTATDCIDPHLGESDLPPIPPVAIFESRFDLTPYGCGPKSTYKDYRAPGNPPAFPFTGMIEHTLWWQTSSPGLPILITYDIPPGALMKITDQIGGIFLNIGPFSGQGTAIIPGSYTSIFARAYLKMYYYNIGGVPTPDPIFSMSPDSLDFGIVQVGQTKTLPLAITNSGYEDSLYIFDTISSDTAFTISPNIFPIIITPLSTQFFNITYSAVFGTHIDSILFIHNAEGSPNKLTLYATTYEPHPECHAQVESKVIISDGEEERWMRFGLDSSGTDEIDPQLGEFGPLAPFPAAGVFEVQFFLPENNFWGTLSSYCDYRGADLPFMGQKEWRLVYQTAYEYEITITWNFPPYITGVLQDIINGSYINAPMVDSGSYTVTNPYVFNRLRMLIDFNITTPVELVSFSASLVDKVIQLSWTTATEINNSGFKIERASLSATPGQGWEKIGFVPGFGTTTEPKLYSFVDENISSGIYKYRLKQIDFDGTFNYSNDIEVEVDFTPKEFVLYQNYPNPFNPSTTIKFTIPSVIASGAKQSQFITLKVFDVLGNEVATLVNEEKQTGVYEVEFVASSLASGMYLYKLQAGSFVQTKKMILAK